MCWAGREQTGPSCPPTNRLELQGAQNQSTEAGPEGREGVREEPWGAASESGARNFPGAPVAKTLCFHWGNSDLSQRKKRRVRRRLRRGRLGSTPWGPGLQVPFCQEEARAPYGKGKHTHGPFGPRWRNKIRRGSREEAGGPGWKLRVREPGKDALGQAPRGRTVRVGHSWALLYSQDQRRRWHLARDRDTESAPFELVSKSLRMPTKLMSAPSGLNSQHAKTKQGPQARAPRGTSLLSWEDKVQSGQISRAAIFRTRIESVWVGCVYWGRDGGAAEERNKSCLNHRGERRGKGTLLVASRGVIWQQLCAT